eukprot:CAMPEP_0204643434 /NCGR_PEP_ID=MMETSP0718-20130828/705_1 /ASSEMBLY_ACC=CAM_ASM_000674 /TAXON_ID=230516 /ORGANISM="Chaetoceros curvisetus" /LENGTH=39 /DNA_ID= /DNA_START= /DNA_END= /DNA_ORIENTATION=
MRLWMTLREEGDQEEVLLAAARIMIQESIVADHGDHEVA